MDNELAVMSESFKAAQKSAYGNKVTANFHDNIVQCVGLYTAFAEAHNIAVEDLESAQKLLDFAERALGAGGNKYHPDIVLFKLSEFTLSYSNAIHRHLHP